MTEKENAAARQAGDYTAPVVRPIRKRPIPQWNGDSIVGNNG